MVNNDSIFQFQLYLERTTTLLGKNRILLQTNAFKK